MELRAYMKQLTKIHEAIHTQEQNRGPREEEQAPGAIQPGDQVYLRVFRRRWNEPRREGPYTVVRATPTAVQVEGSTTWYHLNHCTRVPRLRPRRREEQIESDGGEGNEQVEGEGEEQIETPVREQTPEAREPEGEEESNIDEPHFRETERAEAAALTEDGVQPPEVEREGQGETDRDLGDDISAAEIAQDAGQSAGPFESQPSTSAQPRYQPDEFDEFFTLDPSAMAELFPDSD
jgi:hypothetical protein